MAVDEDNPRIANEETPLLANGHAKPAQYSRFLVYRALFCGFMISLSFAVTQVPLIYVFRLMTCDAYYTTHPKPEPGVDRCNNREIEAGTSLAVSLLGASTTCFGVINLFVTGWTIKRVGVKSALIIQVFWPAVRLAIQNVGVMTGGAIGMTIIQCSQIITIIGGPSGYLLALNSYITEIVEPSQRTPILGMLSGAAMFGTSLGYLAGGLISDAFGILAPFRVTLALFLTSCLYVFFALKWIPQSEATTVSRPSNGLSRFFGPLKIFTPQKWILKDGRIRTEYGAILLGTGAFFGVLATGYIPVLLQMYSTDEFGFDTTHNGYLISLNSFVRGLFLTIAFPRIISSGRKWLRSRDSAAQTEGSATNGTSPKPIPEPNQLAEDEAIENEEDIGEFSPPQDDRETYIFDLLFTKYSLIVDGILTAAATFVTEGWQMYVIAVVLPFASGTASAAKGTMLQMCPPNERTDALSAITLLELIAKLSTTAVFGIVFAFFASIGKTHLVFLCNGAIALVGYIALTFAHFPPDGSERLEETHDETTPEIS